MRIRIERTGGFTGIRTDGIVDINDLGQGDADEITSLIAESNFFDLPAKIEEMNPAPDQFQYSITIDTKEKSHTVEVEELVAPELLMNLLNKLMIIIRSRRT
jgi:hypothetical protein